MSSERSVSSFFSLSLSRVTFVHRISGLFEGIQINISLFGIISRDQPIDSSFIDVLNRRSNVILKFGENKLHVSKEVFNVLINALINYLMLIAQRSEFSFDSTERGRRNMLGLII